MITASTLAGISESNLSEAFDRVVVVNLKRRPDRLERFWSRLADWPFKQPQRFEAVDGHAIATPSQWEKGAGAWGCMLSHRQVLDQAIQDRLRTLLVLEDDAYPVDHFSASAAEFLKNVPGDWDGLMFGAEHLVAPQPVGAGIVRCTFSNRAHAYAVRGHFMEILSEFWHNTTNDHCDVVLCSLMGHFKFYAPDPLLIGQDSGLSDINGRQMKLRFLSANQKAVIGQNDSRNRVESLINQHRPTHASQQALAGI